MCVIHYPLRNHCLPHIKNNIKVITWHGFISLATINVCTQCGRTGNTPINIGVILAHGIVAFPQNIDFGPIFVNGRGLVVPHLDL